MTKDIGPYLLTSTLDAGSHLIFLNYVSTGLLENVPHAIRHVLSFNMMVIKIISFSIVMHDNGSVIMHPFQNIAHLLER